MSDMPGDCPSLDSSTNLEDLPMEILWQVFSMLSANFVLTTVTLVCKRFRDLITADLFWKNRIFKRWPNRYPVVLDENADFDWVRACIQRENKHKVWSEDLVSQLNYSHGITSSVDTVHMFSVQGKKLMATGSRDRTLNLIDLDLILSSDSQPNPEASLSIQLNAHKGWIWALDSYDNNLCSGSWDQYISIWDVSQNCSCSQRVKCKSSVLCLNQENNFVAAGCFDKKVVHVDLRVPNGIVAENLYHRRSVLCLASDQNYIVTGSEDGTVAFYNRSAGKVEYRLSFDDFPMSFSYEASQLWLGDKSGQCYVCDLRDSVRSIAQKYELGHSRKITGIIHSLGCIYSCDTKGNLIVSEPNLHPSPIRKISLGETEIAKMDYKDNVLALALSTGSVRLFQETL